MDPQLRKYLVQANLEHAIQGFIDGGVTTVEQFNQLTMQEYQSVGIVGMKDRRNVFELIQLTRREHTSSNASSGPSTATADYGNYRSVNNNFSSGRGSARPEALSGRPAHTSSVPVRVATPLRNSNPITTSTSALRRDPELAKSASALRRDPREESFLSSKVSVSGGSARGGTGVSVNAMSSRPDSAVGGRAGSTVGSRPASRGGVTPLRQPSAEMGSTSGGAARRRPNRITVVIRKRPLSHSEEAEGLYDILVADGDQHLTLLEPKQKVDLTKYIEKHRFVYDLVLDEHKGNRYVYEKCCRPLMDTVFEGGVATCFAYGQTGSGKTYTMLGRDSQEGMYLMAAKDLYARLEPGMNINVSFFEIYGVKLYDLLNEREKLACREDHRGIINICGLTEHRVDDTNHLMQVIAYGNTIRAAGSTSMNADSSRSHAILHLTVVDAKGCFFGRFTFIDLAGSERGADTISCDRTTRYEGAQINKSLLTLKECIRALDQNHRHIPFRGSKLTAVLRDCFTGNSRTVMIGNVSPASGSCEHTLNTLRYADRVKELKKDRNSRTADEIMMGQMPTEEVEVVGLSSSFADRRAQERKTQTSTTHLNDSRSSSISFNSTPLRRPLGGGGVPSRQPDETSHSMGDSVHSRSSFQVPNCSQQRSTAKPAPSNLANSSRHATPVQREEPMRASTTNTAPPSAPNADFLAVEEDVLILSHRKHIEAMMDLLRREMKEAETAENPETNMVRYCNAIDNILGSQVKRIERLRAQIGNYLAMAESVRRR